MLLLTGNTESLVCMCMCVCILIQCCTQGTYCFEEKTEKLVTLRYELPVICSDRQSKLRKEEARAKAYLAK